MGKDKINDDKELSTDGEDVTKAEEVFEDLELEDLEDLSDQKIKKIREKLKKCEAEKMQHMEDLQRAKAEFLNAKMRLNEDQMRNQERAIVQHVEKILPLCDSFHMAMSNSEAWNAIDEQWRKGVESIYTQLQNILASYDVTETNPLGESFDPNIHEAMAKIPVDEETSHEKIISVIQNGFIRTKDGVETLIRPARVTVGEYTK